MGRQLNKLTMDERMELNDLRALNEYLSKKLYKLNERQKRLEEEGEDEGDAEGEEGENEEEEQHSEGNSDRPHTTESEEEEDDIEELPPTIAAPPKFRKSVSAEAYGLYNKKGYFTARSVEK